MRNSLLYVLICAQLPALGLDLSVFPLQMLLPLRSLLTVPLEHTYILHIMEKGKFYKSAPLPIDIYYSMSYLFL